MILDCSTQRSIENSICQIFNIDKCSLSNILNRFTLDDDKTEAMIGNEIYDEIVKYYPIPNERIDILWFHGTLSNNPLTFFKEGIKQRALMREAIEVELKSCAQKLRSQGAIININQDPQSKIVNEGPFGFLISLDLYPPHSYCADYSREPELVTDIAEELYDYESRNLIKKEYKKELKSYDVAFIAPMNNERFKDLQLTETNAVYCALGALKFLKDKRELDSYKNLTFDGNGQNIKPKQIERVIVPKRLLYSMLLTNKIECPPVKIKEFVEM